MVTYGPSIKFYTILQCWGCSLEQLLTFFSTCVTPLSSPTSDLLLSLIPFECPPRMSITKLICLIPKPGCCLLWAPGPVGYILRSFFSSFRWQFSTQGQLISKSVILLLSLSTILASTLLALTSGGKDDPSNYGTIALLPTSSKILEKAIHTQLN